MPYSPSPTSVSLTVTDVDEPPTISGPPGVNHPENTVAVADYHAEDPEQATVTWSLADGPDSSHFAIDGTGRLSFTRPPDHENRTDADNNNVYNVTLQASDNVKTATLDVAVIVVDAAGTLALPSQQPQVGRAMTAELDDPDGVASGTIWLWQRSADRTTWTAADGARSSTRTSTYTPVQADVNRYLRVTATYTDGHGSNKRAQVATGATVETSTRRGGGGGGGGGGGEEENDQPPDVEPAGFVDVRADGVHTEAIEALYAAGITSGCQTEPLSFCPDQPVTRAQMASFLTRSLELL